jgi:hypothetical protein
MKRANNLAANLSPSIAYRLIHGPIPEIGGSKNLKIAGVILSVN